MTVKNKDHHYDEEKNQSPKDESEFPGNVNLVANFLSRSFINPEDDFQLTEPTF